MRVSPLLLSFLLLSYFIILYFIYIYFYMVLEPPTTTLPSAGHHCSHPDLFRIMLISSTQNANKVNCPKCGASRWSYVKGSSKKIPQKVLWYFPIKPRLQRLFISKDIAKQMRWHKDGRKDDNNTLGHLADGIELKEFDKEHDWFVCDFCNVRLGLASDGFNPFGNISLHHIAYGQ
jgi:hypothetical protein